MTPNEVVEKIKAVLDEADLCKEWSFLGALACSATGEALLVSGNNQNVGALALAAISSQSFMLGAFSTPKRLEDEPEAPAGEVEYEIVAPPMLP